MPCSRRGVFVGQDDVVVHRQHLGRQGVVEARVRVDDLARTDEGGHLRRVGQRDRKLGRHPVALLEPVYRVEQPVLVFEDQMLDPVDVGPLRQTRRDRMQGVGLGVDVQLAVEHRGRRAARMEADEVALAAVDREAVDEEIVVEHPAAVGQRRGEADVEDVDEVVVEVDAPRELAGELGDREGVVHARDAVGADHLARDGGAPAVVVFGLRLGDHRRKVALAGEGRCIDVFEDEAEVALHPLVAEGLLDVRQPELHFGIGLGAVAVVFVGVVEALAADEAVEDREGGVGARRHDHLVDRELGLLEGEVDLVEAAPFDGFLGRDVAHHLGLQRRHAVARFERVDAVFVGDHSDGRARKDDADELQRSPLGIGHPAADARRLRQRREARKKGRQDQDPAFHLVSSYYRLRTASRKGRLFFVRSSLLFRKRAAKS